MHIPYNYLYERYLSLCLFLSSRVCLTTSYHFIPLSVSHIYHLSFPSIVPYRPFVVVDITVLFLCPLCMPWMKTLGRFRKLGYDRFLPRPFRFVVHWWSCNFICIDCQVLVHRRSEQKFIVGPQCGLAESSALLHVPLLCDHFEYYSAFYSQVSHSLEVCSHACHVRTLPVSSLLS